MTFLLILLAVTLLLSANGVRRALRDDRGTQRPPSSHFEDPAFRAPAR